MSLPTEDTSTPELNPEQELALIMERLGSPERIAQMYALEGCRTRIEAIRGLRLR